MKLVSMYKNNDFLNKKEIDKKKLCIQITFIKTADSPHRQHKINASKNH